MDKMHCQNIIKSIFLGIIIGIALQFYNNAAVTALYRAAELLCSGFLGLIIGFITEWITSKLPISLANTRNYFLINTILALFVTSSFVGLALLLTNSMKAGTKELLTVFVIVLGIVLAANIADYCLYCRTQNKLKLFKRDIE